MVTSEDPLIVLAEHSDSLPVGSGNDTAAGAYLPQSLRVELADQAAEQLSRRRELYGAVLVLDIAGFTPIVAALSERGPEGIDALQSLLKDYFKLVVDVTREFGGDIWQFAGDSVVALFEAESTGPAVSATCVDAARGAAFALQTQLRRFDKVSVVEQTFSLVSRAGVGAGKCDRWILGDAAHWFHPVLTGAAVEEGVAAEQRCAPGAVCLGENALQWSETVVPGAPHLELPTGLEQAPSPSEEPGVERAERFVHRELRHRLNTVPATLGGDFRELACLFVQVEYGALSDSERYRSLDALFRSCQALGQVHNAGVLGTDFSDKGDVLQVIFGAPVALERKEWLACRLAVALQAAASACPGVVALRMGISTGPAFWGEIGTVARRGCWAIGEHINLASRLMVAATPGEVWLEEGVQRKLGGFASCRFIERALLKGIAHPVPVYRLDGLREPKAPQLRVSTSVLVGRANELRQLDEALDAAEAGTGRMCLIVGEAGLGKSRLALSISEAARRRGMQLLSTACYSYHTFTPFFPWRNIFRELLGLGPEDTAARMTDRIEQVLVELGHRVAWTPVLAGVLGVTLEEATRTQELDLRQKQRQVFQILAELLERASRNRAILVWVEDAHWADRMSLSLLEHFALRFPGLAACVLITSRPDPPVLTQTEGVMRLGLSHLDEADSRLLLRELLKLEPPQPELEDRIQAKVQGSPFFAESVVSGLLDQGILQIQAHSGRHTLARELVEVQIPDSVQDVVLRRLDLLAPAESMLVKVAAVVGRTFFNGAGSSTA